MKLMDKMMWMGVGLGAGLLYKTYEKDICSFMKKEKRMMNNIINDMTCKSSSK